MLKQTAPLAFLTLALGTVDVGLSAEKPTLAPLLNETTPAVVSVTVVTAAEEIPLPNDPLFRRFFSFHRRCRRARGSAPGSSSMPRRD